MTLNCSSSTVKFTIAIFRIHDSKCYGIRVMNTLLYLIFMKSGCCDDSSPSTLSIPDVSLVLYCYIVGMIIIFIV